MYEFLCFYIHCTGFSVYQHVHEATSTDVLLLVLYNSAEQHRVHSVNESVFERVIQQFIHESFDMNDSVSHLLKQGLAAIVFTSP